jgi:hypothetical protein
VENLTAKADSTLGLISIKNFQKFSKEEKERALEVISINKNLHYHREKGYNFPILEDQEGLFTKLYSKFYRTAEVAFKPFSEAADSKQTCWCLYSTEGDWVTEFHDHLKTSTINAVFYLQLNDSDSITFLDASGEEHIYYPEEYELLIFPNYLVHSPNKSKVYQKARCSINMEIKTVESSTYLFEPFLQGADADQTGGLIKTTFKF